MEKIKLALNSCLLGEKVRCVDGRKLDHFLTATLGDLPLPKSVPR